MKKSFDLYDAFLLCEILARVNLGKEEIQLIWLHKPDVSMS